MLKKSLVVQVEKLLARAQAEEEALLAQVDALTAKLDKAHTVREQTTRIAKSLHSTLNG